jgi:hypothetical protein
MKTDDAKRIYAGRAAAAELIHADLRTWRGLRQLRVRGRDRALAFARLQALTYDVLRIAALRAA